MSENREARRVVLQILEAIRASNPELIADNMPAGWGMNRLRAELHSADDFPPVVVGEEHEFYAELQEAELPQHERLRAYTGQKVKVISGPLPKDDPDNSDFFVVRTADGREFTAAEEELNGWDKALGQFFWPDGTYGPGRDRTYLSNERLVATSV